MFTNISMQNFKFPASRVHYYGHQT